MNTEIWLADFHFYYKLSAADRRKGVKALPFIVKDIITKKIPTRFILNERLSYQRAIAGWLKTFASTLEEDPVTGLKKFTIKFTRKIGEVYENKTGDTI